jgi:hypothetical protein
MLPFMKKKHQTGVIVTTRPSDEPKQDESESPDSIEYCAEDLMKAVHANDKKGVAEALRSAFTILDSEPHDEGEHTNESKEHAVNEE